MLHIRLLEARGERAQEQDLFGPAYLLRRPLLEAIDNSDPLPPVLLIDEIDRSDAEFEAYLLEVLSDFQISIPEIGTIRALHPPVVIVTSNRTREVHDALKRRCLYHWIEYPTLEREYEILTLRLPGLPDRLARQGAAFVQRLRQVELYKIPGIAETLDWAEALMALDREELEPELVEDTLGALLKVQEDLAALRGDRVRLLRDLGLQVDPHRARLFAQALAQVGVAERSDFYFAARSCLIYRQQDLADFDRAFEDRKSTR